MGKGAGKGSSGGGGKHTPMSKDAAARIQSSEAKAHGGGVPKGSFASRAQFAADKKGAASRVQSAEAKAYCGGVEKGGYAARAQSTADKRAAAEAQAQEAFPVFEISQEAATGEAPAPEGPSSSGNRGPAAPCVFAQRQVHRGVLRQPVMPAGRQVLGGVSWLR